MGLCQPARRLTNSSGFSTASATRATQTRKTRTSASAKNEQKSIGGDDFRRTFATPTLTERRPRRMSGQKALLLVFVKVPHYNSIFKLTLITSGIRELSASRRVASEPRPCRLICQYRTLHQHFLQSCLSCICRKNKRNSS